MRSGKPRWAGWAARLAIAALALNALVPVHLAFDLGEALTPPSRQVADSRRGDEWHVLAFLTGHFDCAGKSGHHDEHHRAKCPVCSSLGMLAGFAPTAVTVLPVPAAFAAIVAVAATSREPAKVKAAAYFSRAPPLS